MKVYCFGFLDEDGEIDYDQPAFTVIANNLKDAVKSICEYNAYNYNRCINNPTFCYTEYSEGKSGVVFLDPDWYELVINYKDEL